MSVLHRLGAFVLLFSLADAACSSDTPTFPVLPSDGGADALAEAGADALTGGTFDAGAGASPVETVPLTETLHASTLSGAVDIVRDRWGIPHIYGATLADVLYGQGFIMARDRFVQMDLARHQATGTVAELAGVLSPSVIDGDIAIRAHHLKKTASDGLTALKTSTDPRDKAIVATFSSFAAGVNAYLDELQQGKFMALDDV